eukprot:4008257-Alexandrium_andersonii.AAC.1
MGEATRVGATPMSLSGLQMALWFRALAFGKPALTAAKCEHLHHRCSWVSGPSPQNLQVGESAQPTLCNSSLVQILPETMYLMRVLSSWETPRMARTVMS